VVEALNTVTNVAGQTQWNLFNNDTQSRINLSSLTAVGAANTGSLVLNAGGAMLGASALGTAAAPGAGRVNVFATTANLSGSAGAAGTKTMSIRPDVIGIDSTGSGFVTSDTGGFRLMSAAEYQVLPGLGSGLGAVVSGSTTNASGLVTLLDLTGLQAGMSLVAVANGIPTTATISSINTGASQVTFSANATSTAAARFALTVPAGVNAVTGVLGTVQQAATVNSLTLDSGGGLFFQGGNLTAANSAVGQDFGISGALNTLTVTSGGKS
jgi:hypothetical protein